MAESKRGARKPRKGLPRMKRLGTVNLVLNGAAAIVGAPVLFVLAVLLWMGEFEGTDQNQHLFLGAVCILLGVFLILLGGLKVREHIVARRRFAELMGGDRKSTLAGNVEELEQLARALGPSYMARLRARMDELGVKR